MLYIYGTVYNNKNVVVDSITSLNKIKFPHKFLIIDNFSTDGTYETLEDLRKILNIEVKRVKCSRGLGRQLAMEIAMEESKENDLFFYFDLDTIFTNLAITIIEYFIKNMNKNDVIRMMGLLCYRPVNFNVPWKDLNNGEDFERSAHFLALKYNVINIINKDEKLYYNEKVEIMRDRRYEKGYRYYMRQLRNSSDLIVGNGIDSLKKLRQSIRDASHFKHLAYVLLLISYIYVKKFQRRKIYRYDNNMINSEYYFKNVKMVLPDELSKNL